MHSEHADLIEELAELEHDQWSDWVATVIATEDNLSPERLERWEKLSRTPYSGLTESQKDADRFWARKALDAILGPMPRLKTTMRGDIIKGEGRLMESLDTEVSWRVPKDKILEHFVMSAEVIVRRLLKRAPGMRRLFLVAVENDDGRSDFELPLKEGSGK